MQYRNGDQVIVEIDATVIGAEGEDRVRVSIGGHEIETTASMLQMVRRSIHKDDEVMHGESRARVIQLLESNVFLLNVHGAIGADAYRVAAYDELRHADAVKPRAIPAAASTQEAPRSSEAAPVADAPAAPATPAAPAAPASEEQGSAAAPTDAPRAGFGAMAESLSGLVRGRDKTERRQPIDLESMGTTETVPDVGAGRSELLLGDDQRLPE